MSNFNNFYALDADGDFVAVQESGSPEKGLAFINTAKLGAWLTREHAVGVISALTDLVQAHDEAEEKAAAKLKAGDKVLGASRRFLFLVITDEDANGLVDLVKLRTGEILRGRTARHFTRRASAGEWVDGPVQPDHVYGPF